MNDKMWADNEKDDDEEDKIDIEMYLQKNKKGQRAEEWEEYESDEDAYQRYYESYYEDYQSYPWYQEDYNWLIGAAGTDDPEVMNDVYWNMD